MTACKQMEFAAIFHYENVAIETYDDILREADITQIGNNYILTVSTEQKAIYTAPEPFHHCNEKNRFV